VAQIDVSGTSLEYIERGNAEPVVLVHGSASDYRTWQYQMEPFGAQFRAVAYSRRYHWPNQRIHEGADYSMAEHVDDLRTVLRSLGGAPAHLVGHSYGAFLCLLLAIREPELVRTLVLAEPPVVTLFVSLPPKAPELLKLLLVRPRTAIAIMKFGALGLGPATAAVSRDDMEAGIRIFGSAVLGPEAYARLSEPRREQVHANFFKAEFLGSSLPPLDERRVRDVRTPVLLVNGQQSPRLFHRLTDRLQELLAQAERIEIPGASHIMYEDNAPFFNAAVLAFLNRHRGAQLNAG
jgi:non-heme chloroperoxidase